MGEWCDPVLGTTAGQTVARQKDIYLFFFLLADLVCSQWGVGGAGDGS